MSHSLSSRNMVAPVQPPNQVRITFTAEASTLIGTLYKPVGNGPFPTIVVVHSASAGTHDAPIYVHLAHTMNAIGVAVYSYDRRGEDLPWNERIHPGYMALGRDALAAVRMLQARPEVDANHIGLWGISQGGWVAPAAYVQSPREIAFMILLSSSGVGPAQQMVHAVPRVLRALGYDEAVAETGARLREQIDAYYRGEITREAAQMLIDWHKDEPWFAHVYVEERLPVVGAETGWANETAFAPWEVFSQITVPLLLLYGENDPWIPVEESMAIWHAALIQAGNQDGEIHCVPRTGHSMVIDEPAYLSDEALAERTFSPIYVHLLQDFVHRVVGG